nr:hypothetical protein [Actinomycetota bacterium]
MKFWGKKNKPVPMRREVIHGHAWTDPILDAALAELEEGHLRAATTVLAEVRDDPERRDLRLTQLSRPLLGHASEVAALAERHGDPELALLAGVGYLGEAGTIRGPGSADSVGEDRVKLVHATAEKALPYLHAAAGALPDDPIPWHEMMGAGQLLDMDREQQDHLWAEVHRRCPTMWTANQS